MVYLQIDGPVGVQVKHAPSDPSEDEVSQQPGVQLPQARQQEEQQESAPAQVV